MIGIRHRSSAAMLLAVLATTGGCGIGPTNVVGDPAPGYVHIVSIPPEAIEPLTVRFASVGVGGPSTVFFEYDSGDPILLVFPSTPGNSALQVNGVRCDGQWAIQSQVETDVLLLLDGEACRTEVVGTHAVGAVHFDPQTEPQIDGD